MRVKGIYSKRCWLEDRLREATIYFTNGVITEIREATPNNWDGIENAGNNVVMPGIIDAHVKPPLPVASLLSLICR